MSQVDLLYRLQQIDDEISEKKHRFSEILQLQKGNNALNAARKQAESAAAELQNWRTKQNDLNLELSGLNDKVKRSEDRLYSGQVKNPKELSDLQHEIESLKRRRAGLEDEVLEAMIMLEDAQEVSDKAAADLAQLEEKWAASQAEYKAEQSELVQRINELNGVRQEQTENISPQYMAAYNSAIKKVMRPAVVLLKNTRCRGCQVTVPATLVKAADEGKLTYCDSCGRILVPA